MRIGVGGKGQKYPKKGDTEGEMEMGVRGRQTEGETHTHILRAKEACGQKDLSLTPHAAREPYRDRNRNTEKDRHTQA